MKTIPTLFLSLILFPAPLLLGQSKSGQSSNESEVEWSFALVQKQVVSGGIYQADVEKKGSSLSHAPIPDGGSQFSIWAYRREGSQFDEFLVDTDNVGTYMPEGTLKITTKDPYSAGIPRTRVDQGFTVHYTVDGLSSDAKAPEAAKKVLLDHSVAMMDDQLLLGNEANFKQSFIDTNGASEVNFLTTNLPISNPYKESGQEIFRIYALPDGEVAQSKLAEAKVQIWPLSKADFVDIDTSRAFQIVPEIKVALTDLYPDSETWAQIYKGPAELGTVGTRLNSYALINDREPVTKNLRLEDVNDKIKENGTFTLEILTKTPFGVERLNYITFEVDRNLDIRGNLNFTK